MLVRSLSVLGFSLLLGAPALLAQTPAEQAAEAADIQWMHLLDAAQYQAAYDDGAPVVRTSMSQTQFAKSFAAAREPLGTLKTRTLADAQETTKLPGAPDGRYVVAHYNSSFANKADAVETVIATKQPDGTWRVAGYFIR